MKVFANLYEYSKEKSSTILNKKKTEVEVEKKGASSCWAKTFFEKFEETKKNSYEYMEKIHNKIKNKSNSLFANFSFLKFDHDPKYNMFPWYTRLYFILKDQIKKLTKLTDEEDSKIPTEVNTNEIKKNNKKKLSEDIISSNIDVEETNTRSATYSKYSNDLITHRNCKKLKRNNTENINRHASGSKGEEVSSQDNGLFSKRHASTIVNTLRYIHKNKSQDTEEEQFCDVKEITEVVDTNNKEKYNEICDTSNKSDVAIEKGDKVSNETGENSNINANDHDLSTGVVKKFNIKNTWAKFSNIIS